MVAFLRSEDSLCAYSNCQELLAICNLLNIKIYVFTYGIGGNSKSWSWKTICPDPVMAQFSEFAPGTVPHMFLYNSENCHYDLLVEDNSRLAVLGFTSMGEEKKVMEPEVKESGVKEPDVKEHEVGEPVAKESEEVELEIKAQEQWENVKNGKKSSKPAVLATHVTGRADTEEEVLRKHKQSGHKRAGPQSTSVVQTEQNIIVNLEDNMSKMKVSETYCEQCQENFVNNAEFAKHIKSEHSSQWNCNNCDFQASTRTILMNHCKKSPGHQPCNQKQRLGQTGVVECYTCKEEFKSYHDLMNHRKKAHPSKKKCRYYIKGECNFSSEECWYIHENVVKEDSSTHQNSDMECYVCKNTFTS